MYSCPWSQHFPSVSSLLQTIPHVDLQMCLLMEKAKSKRHTSWFPGQALLNASGPCHLGLSGASKKKKPCEMVCAVGMGNYCEEPGPYNQKECLHQGAVRGRGGMAYKHLTWVEFQGNSLANRIKFRQKVPRNCRSHGLLLLEPWHWPVATEPPGLHLPLLPLNSRKTLSPPPFTCW